MNTLNKLKTMNNMKNALLGLSLMTITAITFVSCDDEKVVPTDEIPSTSQTFLDRYFEGYSIDRVEKEGTTYSVSLEGGVEVDFNGNGEWIEVDGADGVAIPTDFILDPIVTYIADQYPNEKINGIEKNVSGYDVDLLTQEVDLLFDMDGKFTGIDR